MPGRDRCARDRVRGGAGLLKRECGPARGPVAGCHRRPREHFRLRRPATGPLGRRLESVRRATSSHPTTSALIRAAAFMSARWCGRPAAIEGRFRPTAMRFRSSLASTGADRESLAILRVLETCGSTTCRSPSCKPGHVVAEPLCVQPSVTEAQLAFGIPTLAFDEHQAPPRDGSARAALRS